MSYVQVKKLSKRFGKNEILHDLSLDIEEGELVTLLGPSGCGKSTLLKCIAGLLPHECGEIWLDGSNITHKEPKDRGIGFMFQSYALFPNMTVYGNVSFGLTIQKKSKAEINKVVNEVLDLVNLKDKINAYPRELSGGQQQRVALARSLVMHPKLMLLDEPLSALDAKIRKNLRLELRRIQKSTGMTFIFVTHDQEEALSMSDRIFLMDNGNIVQHGTPREIYESPRSEFVAGFIGNYNVLNNDDCRCLGIELRDGYTGSLAIRPEIIDIYPAEETNENESEGIWISCTIEEILLLGNMIRYVVSANHKSLQVDIPNLNINKKMRIGESVKLHIKNEEICHLA